LSIHFLNYDQQDFLTQTKIDFPPKLLHLKLIMEHPTLLTEPLRYFMENNRHLEKVTFKLCCDHAAYQYQASIDRIYFLIDLITSSNMPFVKLNVILFNFDDKTMFQIKEKYGPEIFILATNIDRKVNLIFLLKKPNQQTHFILCKS